MSEFLQEFCDSAGVSLRIDRASGVIRGIKVLGLQSRNGREYLPEALTRAVGLYEGAKVNVNHPKGNPQAPRDYQERIGVIRNVRHRLGEGLFADFHFNPKHVLSEQLVWDAQHSPANVGFSHNVQARTSRRGETTLVEEIVEVHSVDLVADPATTRGLFESAAPDAAPQEDTAKNTEDRLRERAVEIEKLQGELDRFRAQEAVHKRRETVLTLLAEHHLPLPESSDSVSKAITSDQFVQSLLSASDEKSIRRLIEERAKLVNSSRQWTSAPASPNRGPMSRDQIVPGAAAIADSKSFARAIQN